jgi:hypothetical protein
MNAHEIRDGTIGATAGIGGAILHWLKLLGEAGSSIASILGAIIAAIMLWRLVFKDNTKGPK